MTENNYHSKLLTHAIEQFSGLPGIGERTAMRLALHLLRLKKEEALRFGESMNRFVENIKYCKSCYNLSDTEVCHICASKNRDKSTVCVVENIRDVISIEKTSQYNGLYHVLGGVISPMDGIGPSDLKLDELVERIANEEINEVILALSATMEGDTTNFYIHKKISHSGVKLSVIARGVSFGNELEYTDEVTLGRSIINRTEFTA